MNEETETARRQGRNSMLARPSLDSLATLPPQPPLRLKPWEQLGWPSRLVLVGAVLQTLLVVILQLVALGSGDLVPRIDLELYAGCFVWSMLYLLFLIVEAVFHENTVQLGGIAFLQVAFVGFATYQLVQRRTPTFYLSLAVLAAFLLLFIVVVRMLVREFQWQAYRRLGADPKLSSMVRTYEVFLVVLKLNFFFTVLFLVQQIFLILGFADYETYISIIVPPIFLAVWFAIVYAIKRENVPITLAFVGLSFLGAIYFLYKVIMFNAGAKYAPGSPLYGSGFVMISQNAGYNIGLYLLTSGLAFQLYRSFDSGLASNLKKAVASTSTLTLEPVMELITVPVDDAGRQRVLL